VNLAAALGLLRYRPRFFFLYAALAGQQVYSHGTYGWSVWTLAHRVDWASVAVLLFFPVMLGCLAADFRRAAKMSAVSRSG
jgi:hypothetical protein